MKPSKFNHFFNYTTNINIAYNSYSNSLALISDEQLAKYKEFEKSNESMFTEQEMEDFKYGSFIVEDEVDELELIRYNMFKSRFTNNVLTLTIAPTSDCNFDCIYCFEKKVHRKSYMTNETQNAIKHFFDKKKNGLKSFTVNWYGGEPLLGLGIIGSLSNYFIKNCEKLHINYTANMITNGYLLSRDVLKRLKQYQINFLQITLDGNPKCHDSRRPLKNGGNTFETIIKNLHNGYDLLPRVSLRVNIDKENVKAGEEVYQYVKKFSMEKKISVYCGCVRYDNECYEKNKCLTQCEFSNIEYDFFKLFANEQKDMYPKLKYSFCGADNVSSLVIAADGNIYKCWSDIDNDEKCIGNINNEIYELDRNNLCYMLFDPTKVLPCKNCKILPICMGGCTFHRLSEEIIQCSKYKYILERCLIDKVKKMREEV